MATSPANIQTISFSHGEVIATFDADIGYLKAGAEICLQQSDNVIGSGESGDYAMTTLGQCHAIVNAAYDAEKLSIMIMTESADIDGIEIREATTHVNHVEDGYLVTGHVDFHILKHGNAYYAVGIDPFYAENGSSDKVWTQKTDLDWTLSHETLKSMFNESEKLVAIG